MKYILKYNESKTQTFVDWLKDIEDHKINENRYKFEFPVKKIFNIDDKVDIDNIPKFLKEEKEIDICEVIANEIELGFLKKGDIFLEEVEANFKKYFKDWIEQKFDGDITRFYRMYDLDFEKLEISEADFEKLKSSFNSLNLEGEYPYREFGHDFTIESITIESIIDGNIIKGNIITNRELVNDEIDSITDFITGQLSDDWGQSIVENIIENIHGIKFNTFIVVWWSDGYPGWYLNIE